MRYTYSDASLCPLGIAETYACNALSFLVEENHIRDVGHFGAFFPDVFFDFEYGGRIFLCKAAVSSGCDLVGYRASAKRNRLYLRRSL